MNKVYVIGATMITSVAMAVAVASPVLAWHPKGQINKSVKNVTQHGSLSDANTAAAAVEAKTGDILTYVVEIKNVGTAASNGYNDMHYTVLRDTLPQGVVLVSDPAKREIVENLGILKPGQKVTKSYDVRVTNNQDKAIITNKACFTGDSEVHDNKQSGCDDAVVKVFVPKVTSVVTEEPSPNPKPQVKAAVTPAAPAVTTLPATGPENFVGAFAGVSGLGYAAHRFVSRKRK